MFLAHNFCGNDAGNDAKDAITPLRGRVRWQ